jgi:predicted dehydrogenase
MKRNYRWGILGAGRIAEKFAAALNYTEGAELYAIASRDVEKGRAFATAFKATKQYNRYEDLVMDAAVDIIYIATPHAFHCEHALLCLRHRKPVLCEKPLALNEREATKMTAEARRQEVFLMEGMWSRFMPSINKAKELVGAGVIGPVQYLHADFGFKAPYDVQGRLYNRKLGGGSLLDVGIYPVFLSSFLLGEPATIHTVAGRAATGADEYCNVVFQYPGGQTAHIFSAINVQTGLQAEIAGTEGRILLQRPWYKSEELVIELSSGETRSLSFPLECNGFEYEIREVMECLDKGFSECPALPLDFSLQMSRTIDSIGRQAGVAY